MKKYPRTYHLPWSEGRTLDDKTLLNVDHFIGKEVVVTEKMDGENTSIYQDYIHARSLDSNNHPSRDWVKAWASTWQFELPDSYRICGENLYAKHSIPYNNLKSYFYGFSVWKDELCLSWKDTIEWFDLLGIVPVPVVYNGIYDQSIIQTLWNESIEGYVVRLASEFDYIDFDRCVAKFVRKNHVQTDEHWMQTTVVPNKLIDNQ